MKKIFTIVPLLIIFLTVNFQQTWAASQNLSFESLKTLITKEGFTKELFEKYEFAIINSPVDLQNEISFLSQLNNSFEKQYLQALIYYKLSNFQESFEILIPLLTSQPKHYQYYDLLTKTAAIINKEPELTKMLAKIPESKYKYYLSALLDNNKTKYSKAKETLEKVILLDSTSFDPLYKLSYANRYLGDYEKALKILDNAKKKITKDHPFYAQSLVAKGSLFYLSGQYDKSEKIYSAALKHASDNQFNTEKIKALLNLAIIYDEAGEIEKSRKNFDMAIKLAKEINDAELEAVCLSEKAVSFTFTGELIAARENYNKSFELFKKLKNINRLALTANNIGNIYLNISNHKSALEYYTLGLNNSGENIRTRIISLRGIGDVYTNLSNYSKALEYYTLAKKLAKQINDIPSDVEINIGLGILYYNIDLSEKALKVLRERENDLNESETPFLLADLYQNIGKIYISMDSSETADNYLSKAADIYETYGDTYNKLLSQTFLSLIQIKKYDSETITGNDLKKLIDETKSEGYNQLLGIQHLFLSELYRKAGNKKSEFENIVSAKGYAEDAKDYNTLIESYTKLGEFYEAQSNYLPAEENFLQAIKLIDASSRILFNNSEIQINYFANFLSAYNSLIELYLTQKKIKEAFQLVDNSRSRNTMQNLIHLVFEKNIKDSTLINKYYDLRWEVSNGIYADDEVDSFTSELKEIENSIISAAPSLKEFFNETDDFNINDIQKQLGKNEFVVSYYTSEDYLYYFIISNNIFKSDKIEVSPNELRELTSLITPYYRVNSNVKEIYFNKDLFAFNSKAAYDFFKKVVSPALGYIPANSDIIFNLPPDMLGIPFEFLVMEDNNDPSPFYYENIKFLINDYTISYTPSIRIWSEMQTRSSNKTDDALLIGDPVFNTGSELYTEKRGLTGNMDLHMRNVNLGKLEYSSDEINVIENILNAGQVFLSENATETIFKNKSENASIIHLSTHSLLYKDNPLILFSSNDDINDGFLEIGEILQLNLSNSLVVLSSCKSGLGKIDKAEGIVGMQKAFLEAGAGSVIVSLWDISDKYTAKFMTYFYSFLTEGVNKSEALRLAKLKFIKEDNPNPYYWAAFTIAGNNIPISILPSRDTNNIIIIGFISALLVLSILSYLFKTKKFSFMFNKN